MLWFLFFILKVVAEHNTNRKDKVSGIVHIVAVLVKLDVLYHSYILIKRLSIYYLSVKDWCDDYLNVTSILKMMFIAIISKSIVTVIKCGYYSKCGV